MSPSLFTPPASASGWSRRRLGGIGRVALTALALSATGMAAVADPESPSPIGWSSAADFSAGSYRWSLSRGGVDFGLGFATPSRAAFIAGSRLETRGPFVSTLPTMSLGLRSLDGSNRSWLRPLADADAETSFIHRIDIEWKPAESQLLFLRQGLGVRLSGDDRLTMQLRKGTLGIYLKRDF